MRPLRADQRLQGDGNKCEPQSEPDRKQAGEEIGRVPSMHGELGEDDHPAHDPSLVARTWVLLTEAPDGGWGIAGHAYLNAELMNAARAELGK